MAFSGTVLPGNFTFSMQYTQYNTISIDIYNLRSAIVFFKIEPTCYDVPNPSNICVCIGLKITIQAMKFEDGSKMRKKLQVGRLPHFFLVILIFSQALEPSLRENDSAFGKSIIYGIAL